MTTLVLKGHATRGKEVINLLEMLGANRLGYKDTFVGFYYYIECGAICSSDEYLTYSTIFTLEEFLEKYPYKVGDEVIAYAEGILASFSIKGMRWNNKLNKVEYKICSSWYDVSMLSAIQPYTDYNIKEEIMEKNQPPKTQAEVDKYLQEHSVKNAMNVIDIETCLETDGLKLPENVVINSKGIGSIQFIQWYEKSHFPNTYKECCDDKEWYTAKELLDYNPNKTIKDMEEKDKAKAPDLKGEDYSDKRFGYKIPDGYEFDTVYNGNIILKPIKPQYPKTYKECCRIVNANPCVRLVYDLSNGQKYSYDVDNLQHYENIRKLLICRDAYWEIAGEEMGLDKPWEPDWSDEIETYYTISYDGVNIKCYNDTDVYSKLAFPSAKIRDAFYENFKELIEYCKELL